MIQGDNFIVDKENTNLPVIKEQFNYPVLYNGGLPAEIKSPKKIKRPWFNRKIMSIKWNDFFEVEKNRMVVFRIIPHASVTNNNKRLWRTIHKMYEMHEGVGKRLERDRFKLTYREKDTFWYDVIFKQEKGKKKIEFYVSTSEYQAIKLKRKLENKMNVTIQEADILDLQVPKQNTIVQELKYLNHDIFSLNTNSQDTKTPIASILNTVDELTYDGDFARLSICNEVENRNKWIKNAQWAHEKLTKGKVPMRANMGGKRAVTAAKVAISGVINEINDLLTDTFQAFSNVFFKSDKDYKKEKVISKAHSVEDEIKAKKVNLDKLNTPVVKSYIRVAAHSHDKLTRESIGENLALSTGDLADQNELHGIKIRVNGRRLQVIDELNNLKLSRKTKIDPNVNLVSTDEMSKLALQMPNKELQRRYSDALNVKKNIETDIPSLFIKDGILIGESQLKDIQIPIHIPTVNPDDLYRAFIAMGGMGSGKDTFIQNFVTEANLNHGISFVVIDQVNKEGRKGMANGIRDSLPPDQIVDIDFSNDEFLPPLDLTEVIEKLGRKGADRFANELIDFMQVDDMGQSRKVLRNFAKACNGSLHQLKILLEDEEYRIQRIKELRKNGLSRTADELDKFTTLIEQDIKRDKDGNIKDIKEKVVRDGQKLLDSKSGAILNRLDEFLGDDTLFSIFAQPPKREFSLEKLMKEGKVIIFRVPDRILSTVAVRTLVHWITLQSLMTRLLMSNDDQENGCFIIYNEPQTYLSGNAGLANLMKRIAVQGRKERLGSIFACHFIGQIKEISDDLISGGVHWLLFKNDNEDTFKKLEHFLKPNFEISDALNIPNTTNTRHAICILDFGGEKQPAFLTKTLIPSYERYAAYDNSFLTQRHSRQYGRHIEEIEELINDKEKFQKTS